MCPVLSSGTFTNYAYARYAAANMQTQANTNDCNTGTNCAITSPQSQGDGTANSPTNLQISKLNEQDEQDGGVEEPLPDDPIGFLRLITEFVCPQGFVCPSSSLKIIQTDGVALPDSTSDSRTDIVIFLRTTTTTPPQPGFPTFYIVQQFLPLPPSGLELHSTTRTPDYGPTEITQDDILL